MTNKETVNRNIGLTFDFLKQVSENPEVISTIDENSVIEFIQKDYPEKEDSQKIIPNKFFKVKRSFVVI